MSNLALTSVYVVGDKRQLRSLYGKMARLENRKKPLIDSNFGNCWLGNLVAKLGANWQKIYCRGRWMSLQLKRNALYFFIETAWETPYKFLLLIQKVYPLLKVYFAAEGEGWDAYVTNDCEGIVFPHRYILDMPPDVEYYVTIREVCEQVSAYIGKEIEPTKEALFAAIDEWEEENTDIEKYIIVKEFEVINNKEMEEWE